MESDGDTHHSTEYHIHTIVTSNNTSPKLYYNIIIYNKRYFKQYWYKHGITSLERRRGETDKSTVKKKKKFDQVT